MKEKHWNLSTINKDDREKIELLSRRGTLLRMTTVCGRPVCWEYELNGAHDREGNPVKITAFVVNPL